jgi:DNA-3-methyladenine glycosylase
VKPGAALRRLLALPAPEAARALLGQVLVRRLPRGRELRARIVETEAYLPGGDPAAHVYRGPTPRNAPLYGPPGSVYVYLVYGMHHCLNLAVDEEGVPGCVLIRAAEPLSPGLAAGALSGPGRLCRALSLDTRHSGSRLWIDGAPLTLAAGRAPRAVVVGRRVGLRVGVEAPLRFCDAESPAVSRPRPPGMALAKGGGEPKQEASK